MTTAILKVLFWAGFLTCIWSAANGYHVSLNLPDNQLLGLTLSPNVGSQWPKTGEIDQNTLAKLRQSKPDSPAPGSVQVREFSWNRWAWRWPFLAAVVAMFGSVVGQMSFRASRLQNDSMSAGLIAFRQAVSDLDDDLGKLAAGSSTMAQRLADLDSLSRRCQEAVTQHKEALLAKLGLKRGTAFLSEYAILERAINRAWVSLTDGYPTESERCVVDAQTAAKLVLQAFSG